MSDSLRRSASASAAAPASEIELPKNREPSTSVCNTRLCDSPMASADAPASPIEFDARLSEHRALGNAPARACRTAAAAGGKSVAGYLQSNTKPRVCLTWPRNQTNQVYGTPRRATQLLAEEIANQLSALVAELVAEQEQLAHG